MPTGETNTPIYFDGKAVEEVKEIELKKIETGQEDKISYLQQTFDTEIVVYLCRNY